MERWDRFWFGLSAIGDHNLPFMVETLMFGLSMLMFGLWALHDRDAYLILGLIYTIGSCASILVRETLIPSYYPRPTQVIASLLLVICLYSVFDVVWNAA